MTMKRSRDNGFILTIDGLRINIAGDTEDLPEMQDIKDIGIDVRIRHYE